MKIIISENVKLSIKDIHKYLSKISEKYAKRVVNDIYEIITHIKDAPYIGRYVPELQDKFFRERIYKNFRIIYHVSESKKTIYILYVFSAKQDSNLFFKIHKSELIKFLSQFFN